MGLILTGSRGRGPHAREDSDWDVRLVVHDNAEAAAAAEYKTERGGPVETVVLSLTGFERAGEPGAPDEWDRYSYAYAQVIIDKLDGRIATLVKAKGALRPDEAAKRAREKLDEYINAYYRSVTNHANGLLVESHLDAAESIAAFLTALFAMHERVRPYNKFLVWDLKEHPLEGPAWTPDSLMNRLHEILVTGDMREQQRPFQDIERLARQHGHGDVIDGWEPDVQLLRGEQ